ncbi:MAG: tetratricopeptide repeat protein [Thermodesulfovibrionales bacterium]|nr:tetratricopeptide repeat protein [Thermodesulfovibrionales bacterium]
MDINQAIRLAFEYYQTGKLNEAGKLCNEILTMQPDNFHALGLLGAVCYEGKDYASAIRYLKQALEINPGNANVYYNLGLALHEPKTLDEAIVHYRKALELEPDFTDAYYYLGTALKMQGKLNEAVESFDNALSYDPCHVKARWARCMSRLNIIYPDESSIQSSRSRYRDELIQLQEILVHEVPQDLEALAETVDNQKPFYLAYQCLNDRELQQIYGSLVCRAMSFKYPQFFNHPPHPSYTNEEPLRIGIVSGYFCEGSVWKIPLKGWLENIDKQRFNLYGYHTGNINDENTEIARQSCRKFVHGRYSFENLCKIIREDNLHVLIYSEIGMDPISLKLAALRLAPLQCCAVMGHPQTSGLRTIDYYLSSDLMEPPDADDHYDGKLIRLPNLSLYYTPVEVSGTCIDRQTFNLRPESTLYLCCQSIFKYLPQYDEVYPRIAQQIGDCQFLFIEHQMNYITEEFRLRIGQSFDRFDMNADDYVVFLPRLDPAQYRAINELSNVFLDSIGWSGCNTTFEAVACNLPVVTLPGNLMRGRHAFAILTMMDVTETIVNALDEYISLAVRLGQDAELRTYISEKISRNKHRIYNDNTCIRALEEFLEAMVKEKLT